MTIEELKQALEAATPGPWKDENVVVHPDMGGKHHTAHHIHLPEQRYAIRLGDDKGGERNCEANARLIVAAVNNLPALLKVAEAAQAFTGAQCMEDRHGSYHALREALEVLNND